MDIKIPGNWLREYLKTKASPAKIAECLSLCGPSVEKIEKIDNEPVYSIEVTTNRVDSASVLGIAREASAILPRFKISAKMLAPKPKSKQTLTNSVPYLKAIVDPRLCFRFCAVLIKNVKIGPSPSEIQKKLIQSGTRPINNVVDISNYVMFLFGQPVHTFDYDKILKSKMLLRESRAGERLTTLDGKEHKLLGGDIVIEDGAKRLIDLAGIMGGENSAIDENSKNVLLFIQTYNPANIRKTSMGLAIRTQASMLFERDLDPEMVEPAMRYAVDMFVNLTKGKPAAKILDIYPNPLKIKRVQTNLDFINKRLGTNLSKEEISKSLRPLGFWPKWAGNKIEVEVPTFRRDVSIPEDIVEEVARIYGYQKLPDKLLEGTLPEPPEDQPFDFEDEIKNFLVGWGGTETYTLSLVSKEEASPGALKLKNPLGTDSEYLRTSLMPSLLKAAKENAGREEPFHLFEVANIYLARKNDLPDERIILAGVFANYSYKKAKGVIEALLEKLNIAYKFVPEDSKGFSPSQRISINVAGISLGEMGVTEDGKLIYYEFPMELLIKFAKDFRPFKKIAKFPAQIEDLTFSFPTKTYLGEVVEKLLKVDSLIAHVKLVDTYKDFFTFRIWYQHPSKTLTDKEVETLRNRIIKIAKENFGGIQKG